MSRDQQIDDRLCLRVVSPAPRARQSVIAVKEIMPSIGEMIRFDTELIVRSNMALTLLVAAGQEVADRIGAELDAPRGSLHEELDRDPVVAMLRKSRHPVDLELYERRYDNVVGPVLIRQMVTARVLASYRNFGPSGAARLSFVEDGGHKTARSALDNASRSFPTAWLEAEQSGPSMVAYRSGGNWGYSHALFMDPARGYINMSRIGSFADGHAPPNDGRPMVQSKWEDAWLWSEEGHEVPDVTEHSEIQIPGFGRGGEYFARRVTIHELAHRFQHTMPHIWAIETAWLNRRANGWFRYACDRDWFYQKGNAGVNLCLDDEPPVIRDSARVTVRGTSEVLSYGVESVLVGAYGGLMGGRDACCLEPLWGANSTHYRKGVSDLDYRDFVLGMLAFG